MQTVVNPISDFEDCILFNEDCYNTTKKLTNGSIDLIYLDPPFFTGRFFEANNCQFDDRWEGLDKYLSWLELRLYEFKRILSRTGSIYIHCDWHVSHNIKVLADKIFSRENFLNEIIWKRQSAHNDASQGSRHFGRIHDTILVYTGSSEYVWNQLYLPYDNVYVKNAYRHVDPDSNRRYALGDLTGPGGGAKGNPKFEFLGVERYWRYSKEKMERMLEKGRIVHKEGGVPYLKRYLDEMNGKQLQDIWTDIPPVNGRKQQYPTQKPEGLLKRIMKISSNSGQVIYDPFAGSGTSGVVAFKLNRKWIGSDISPDACKLAFKRLQSLGCNASLCLNAE